MRLNSRIIKLERRQALHPQDCSGCGYPGGAVLRIVFTPHHGPMPTCGVCQRPIDPQGRPMHMPYTRISIGTRPEGWKGPSQRTISA